MKTAIISVLGTDRPGIIAALTGVLYRAGCNLEDISMTILEGEFAMMLAVTMAPSSERKVQAQLECEARRLKVAVSWKIYSKALKRGVKAMRNSMPYMIRVSGRDREGIVYQVSKLLARHGVNVTDLNCKILGYGKQSVYLMMLEADVPAKTKISKLSSALGKEAKRMKLDIQVRPLETISA